MKLLVVDLETTGVFNTDVIVEIGIALVDTDEKTIELVFDKPVKANGFDATKHKHSWIFKNSSLKLEDVDNAGLLEDYRAELQDLFDKYKMTAYNKGFDVRFLKAAGFTLGDSKCLMESTSQYLVFENKDGKKRKPSFEEVYNQFFGDDGKYVEKHRGGADAFDEGRLLLHLVSLKGTQPKKLFAEKIAKVKGKASYFKKFDPIGLEDKIPFGKHKDKIFSEVAKTDARYLKWCVENVKNFDLTDEAKKVLEN
jgi:hypothetical protein